MNKILKVFFAFSLILVATFCLSVKDVNAQVINKCPEGYVCTPISPQPAGCPVGYTCVPVRILTRLSAASPAARLMSTDIPQMNLMETLGVFDIKSFGVDSTLSRLDFDILVSGGKTASDIFSEVSVNNKLASGVKTNMSVNLSESLTKDFFKEFRIYGKFKPGIPAGTKVYVRLVANNDRILAKDNLDRQVPVEATTTTASLITFMSSSTPTLISAGAGISLIDNGTKKSDSATYTFDLTINNPSSKDFYIDKNVSKSTIITSFFNLNYPLTTALPSLLRGDTSGSYVIPANSSRRIRISGTVKQSLPNTQRGAVSLGAIKLANTPNGEITTTITSGLERLSTGVIILGMEDQADTFASNDNADTVTITSAIFNSLKFLFGFSR